LASKAIIEFGEKTQNKSYYAFKVILSALEVCSRQGAIQIHVYLTLPYLTKVIKVSVNRKHE